ncbi:hypothetical protein Stube_06670 [Streptomyces tubercidicus]|uniref:Uncharacterized protein n=1 Tax=Streptomyces tubercidicus TaxID=47759 RepID=A0A640UKY1_9ACTN|nr:hypothetical protein Stube_06670 [Streptomyces tubercidicus]
MIYRRGQAVLDQPRQLVGQVEAVKDHELVLTRPGGQWEQSEEQCRPTSPQEAARLTLSQESRVIGSLVYGSLITRTTT